MEAIRHDSQGCDTVRNLVAVIDAKFRLSARYGLYEYEAAEEGLHQCSSAFERLAANEREQIQSLLTLLTSISTDGRFRRAEACRTRFEEGA